ncbi:metal-dependent hydrolase [Roseomonas marmotae]|uniref:Metal-dependent hydrolase n=1 Tax=Roseomonas marmotae TaxID=2768161 RepID=A0ABS3KCV2_9PROT|nr:metal-dependent hydrolase [Roseomonas marmotae]MBO1075299.1 metal-dependent hydrolase [Roseomonas marmotae]QTI78280.1 metal-dependent hydrolase [Roseomonas marmotae]
MMAGSHIALGAAAWFVAAPRFGMPALDPVSIGLAVFGSLLPDIDHPKSWVGKRVWPISLICGRIFGHRGMTHSLIAISGCIALLLSEQLSVAFTAPLVVGYLSHLAADLLTPGGLRLAWPLRGVWSLPLCRTGSPFEPLVVALVLSWAWGNTAEKFDLKDGLRAAGVCRLLAPELPSLCEAEAVAKTPRSGWQGLAWVGETAPAVIRR